MIQAFTVITARLLFAMSCLGLLFLSQCNKSTSRENTNATVTSTQISLGAFKGSVKDALPKEVGCWKVNALNLWSDAETLKGQTLSEAERNDPQRAGLAATASGEARYMCSGSERKEIHVRASIFTSPENAAHGFNNKKIRLENPQQHPGWKIAEQGKKVVNQVSVGDRIAGEAKGEKWVFWTNGSVLFEVFSIPELGALGDPLEFEKQFPY